MSIGDMLFFAGDKDLKFLHILVKDNFSITTNHGKIREKGVEGK